MEEEELYKKLEELGVDQVKTNLAKGIYGHPLNMGSKAALVKNWISKKEAEQSLEKSEEEIKISKEANDIAKEANKISKSANKLSIWAIIISIISVIISFVL